MIPMLKKKKKKSSNRKTKTKTRISMLMYRRLIIKYHLATVEAEFGPVADKSFDNEVPLDTAIPSPLAAPEGKFFVHPALLCSKPNNRVT